MLRNFYLADTGEQHKEQASPGAAARPAEHWCSRQAEAGTADAEPALAASCAHWTQHNPFEDYSMLKSCFGHTEPQSTPDPESYRLVMRPSCSAFWKLSLKTCTPDMCWKCINAHTGTWKLCWEHHQPFTLTCTSRSLPSLCTDITYTPRRTSGTNKSVQDVNRGRQHERQPPCSKRRHASFAGAENTAARTKASHTTQDVVYAVHVVFGELRALATARSMRGRRTIADAETRADAVLHTFISNNEHP